MENIVSFETAKRLKAAGFPQPDLGAGQVWREERYMHIVVGEDEYGVSVCFQSANGAWIEVNETLEGLVFAPTATDILLEMPDTPFRYSKKYKAFVCGAHEHDKPAEAAASAWLAIHEKKQET